MAFGIVPRQYIKVNDDFLIFIDYPMTQHSKRGNSVTLKLDGDKDMICNFKIIRSDTKNSITEIKILQDGEAVKAFNKNKEMQEYKLSGQNSIKIQW